MNAWKVMVRCAVGTWRLVNNGNTWESVAHVITWAYYDTMAEAEQVAADLNNGCVRGTHAWVEIA